MEAEEWRDREEAKWRGYEAEKRKLNLRKVKGDVFNWDDEMAKVVTRLSLVVPEK